MSEPGDSPVPEIFPDLAAAETSPLPERPAETTAPLAGERDGAPGTRTVAPFPAEVVAALRDARRRIGHYAVLGELGRGGMGVVYRAFDTQLRRPVAIKMVLPSEAAGTEQLERFRREASTAARLRHPGIVAVHEVGMDEGKPYIVMELVEGESLEALLCREPQPPRRLAEILRDVALALEHAHREGIVHRDVKPENIIVERDGRVRLMDFGLAREVADVERLTASGVVLGTPAYMAPEQAAGAATEQGPRSDVYALGAVLYRALAGRPPFVAPSMRALLTKLLIEEPTPPRGIDADVPADLETIALRCLAKEPARRYRTARDVADELQRFADGVPIVTRPIGRLERARVWVRRNRGMAWALAALAALGAVSVGGGAVLLARVRERERAEREAEERARRSAEELQGEQEKRRRLNALIDSGNTLIQRKEWDRAIEDLSRALELEANELRALRLRAFAYQNKGDAKRALSDSTRAIELAPASPEAWALRGIIRVEQQDPAGAIRDLDRAIELHPPSPHPWVWRARARLRLGQDEAAMRDASHAIELEPRLVLAWLSRAEARGKRGDVDGAIADASRAIELEPRSSDAWGLRGVARIAKGDLDGAIADLTRAIGLNASVGKFWGNRASAFHAKREYELAVADATRAIELEPKNARYWVNRSLFRLDKGDVDAATRDATRSIELDPSCAVAWFQRGNCRQRKNLRAEAIADYERGLELAPDHPQAPITRAAIEALRGGRAR